MVMLARTAAVGIAALIVVAGAWAQAQVYRYIDAEGRVIYSDRAPPPDAKSVQTKRLGANMIETSEASLAAQQAAERFPVTLFTFECGDVCRNAEALLNKRGVPFSLVNVQSDEQGMARMQVLSGEDKAPVLAVGDKIIVKGYNDARWQAALDEAGYPKAPASRRNTAAPRSDATTAAAAPPARDGTRAVAPPPRGGNYPKQ